MAGPNLEIFKFGFYLFFPLAMMVHYGNPEWYRRHVIPYREKLFPRVETTNQNLPTNRGEIRQQLEKLKEERNARRQAKEASE
ncbi:hypothetical protein PIIN_05520 [Serendipita indica DSM 11827]|uniref:Uncharacterized protein n=1 Tax=Serendipita indica (strain DSM 11827) TaxID=1109443 RepID=G4TJV0_SERID|nr:hypothetical protein PIIN_05520 [Serendipita indica DSM 11827]